MATMTTDGQVCIEREVNIESRETHYEDIVKSFDIQETCQWITENNFNTVCLQFPDNLLHVSAQISEEIKSRVDIDLYILGDTSYASCCVDSVAAMHVKGQAVVHYGHTCFTKTNIPVLTVLPKKEINVEASINILKENLNLVNKKVCLFYDEDYEHCIDNLSSHWFQTYPQAYIAHIEFKDNPNKFCGRLVKNKNGQHFTVEALEDCICVYLGSRGQTLFNYTISITAKAWYLMDPNASKVEMLEQTMWFKRRRFLIEKCKDAQVVGILVCKLAGEETRDIISRMKQLCKVNGKKSYIMSVGKPNVAKLANFPEIDIYVMIACPENELYQASNKDFYRPIVYPYELDIALNSNRALQKPTHVTDYYDLLPGGGHYCAIQGIQETTDVSLITGKIREIKVNENAGSSTELEEKQNMALESIGQNLQERSWKGLEQKLGETEVKKAEEGRKGIPLQYSNES